MRTHYDNLKVARNAPPEVISAAYRALAQRYHPDRNPGDSDAVRIFAIITRAFEVLGNPDRRREHDIWIAQQEGIGSVQSDATFGPEEYGRSPTTESATSDDQTPDTRLSLLGRLWIFVKDSPWPIAALLVVALPFALLNITPPTDPAPPVAPITYEPVSPPTPMGELPPVHLEKAIPAGFTATNPPIVRPRETRPRFHAPIYKRPPTAPDGNPWPHQAQYLSGTLVLNADGNSTVTVDNTRGSSDVLVKLFSLVGSAPYAVRVCFIPAHQVFTMEDVSPGTYDIRYRNIDSGDLFRYENFELSEHTVAVPGGTRTRFSNVSLTLFKVSNGNAKTYPISESEF